MPTTIREKLEQGIKSLEFRIAALSERFANENSNNGDNPRDTARQINEYGRTLAILRGLLEKLASTRSIKADRLNELPTVKSKPAAYPASRWDY